MTAAALRPRTVPVEEGVDDAVVPLAPPGGGVEADAGAAKPAAQRALNAAPLCVLRAYHARKAAWGSTAALTIGKPPRAPRA